MSGYHWRGNTARCEALRREADAQWEHDQHLTGQQQRRDRERTWKTEAIAAAIRKEAA